MSLELFLNKHFCSISCISLLLPLHHISTCSVAIVEGTHAHRKFFQDISKANLLKGKCTHAHCCIACQDDEANVHLFHSVLCLKMIMKIRLVSCPSSTATSLFILGLCSNLPGHVHVMETPFSKHVGFAIYVCRQSG